MTSDETARYINSHSSAAEDAAVPSDADTSPGQLLARRRKALGLSVQQAADYLHLTMHYIRALEADEHQKLPGIVFVRGYVRAYASYLKLDPTVVVNVFNEFVAQRDGASEEEAYTISRRRRDRNRPWIVVSGLAFVSIAVALWYFGPASGTPAPRPVASGAGSATATAATATLDNAGNMPAAAVVSSTAMPVTPATSSAATPAAGAVPVPVTVATPAFGVATAPQPFDDVTMPSITALPAAGPAAGGTAGVQSALGSASPTAQAVPAASGTPGPRGDIIASTSGASPSAASISAAPATSALDPQALVPAVSANLARSEQQVMPTQVITVDAGGSDLVEILFSGESLVQIDDGSARQIYRDIRVAGDHLRVSGTGPFNVLLGNAATAELHLNGKKIDFTESIRIDNSARLTIGL